MSRTLGPSPFVGRERELALLHGCRADATARGAGGVVLVSGEPGIGKTRLLAEFATQARKAGSLVLIGHSYDGEGTPPYLPFIEALRAYIRGVDPNEIRGQLAGATRLAVLLPELRDWFPDLPAATAEPPERDRFGLFEAVTELLLTAARSAAGGLLLVLEDLHWADVATLALLQHLGRRLAEGPVLLAATYRDPDLPRTHPSHAVLAELSRQHTVERLALQRMGAADVAQLIAAMTGAPASPAVVERIANDSDGNPFFVTELVRQLASDGVDLGAETAATAGWRVPEGVRQVMGSRLARLSEPANELLQAAAVLAAGIHYETLVAMIARPPDELLEPLEELLAAGLLAERSGTYEFAHALIRQTVEAAISLPRRQRLHLRAAEAIERRYANNLAPQLAALAEHFRQAGPLADPEKTIDYSLRAGEAAIAIFAFEEAVTQWRLAFDSMTAQGLGAKRRADLLLRLGQAQFAAGLHRYADAITCGEQAISLYERCGESVLAAEAHAWVGGALSANNAASMNLPRAIAHLQAAERVLGQQPASSVVVEIARGIATAAVFAVRTTEGLAAMERAQTLARQLGNDRLTDGVTTFQYGAFLVSSGLVAEGLNALEQRWQKADRRGEAVAAGISALWRGIQDRLLDAPLEARGWFEREAAQARQARTTRRQLMLSEAASTYVRAGDLATARLRLPELGTYLFDQDPETLTALLVAFYAGDWESAEPAWLVGLDRYRRAGSRLSEAGYSNWLAYLHYLKGDFDQSETWAQAVLEIALHGPHLPYELKARSRLVLLACERGDLPAAHEHVDRCTAVLAAGENWRGLAGRVALAQAVVSATDGASDEAAERFEQALQTFRRYALPWEEAEALHHWGRALLASSDCLRALDRFDAALAIYEACGAGDRWRQRVLVDRRRAASQVLAEVSGVQYPDSLSEREIDVLRLIAAGKSNREIAARLVISVNTVFQHVRSILNKTGCANRTEAATYALRHGLVE